LYPAKINPYLCNRCAFRQHCHAPDVFKLELIPSLDARVDLLDGQMPQRRDGIAQNMTGQPAQGHHGDQGRKA